MPASPAVATLLPVTIEPGGIRYAPGVRAGRWVFATGHKGTADFAGGMAPEVLVMSAKAWEGLNEQDRKIFKDAARESNLYMRGRWKALEEKSAQKAESAGIQVIRNIDRAPFEAAMAGMYAKAAADPISAKLIERIRQVQ